MNLLIYIYYIFYRNNLILLVDTISRLGKIKQARFIITESVLPLWKPKHSRFTPVKLYN